MCSELCCVWCFLSLGFGGVDGCEERDGLDGFLMRLKGDVLFKSF